MKRIILVITSVVMILTGVRTAQGSPAFPGLISFEQPDGTKVSIYLRGDEKVHWAETEDGYSLMYDEGGYLCYAMRTADGDMVASELRATEVNERPTEVKMMLLTTPKKLRYSHRQVTDYLAVWNQLADREPKGGRSKALVGQKKALVVLFQTPDCRLTFRKLEFMALFNQQNYTEHNARGSVYDYYYSASNGQFSLQVDVLGPIMADNNMAYYGSDNSEGSYSFATEVANKIEGMADFSEYDNDGDGVIDGMHIIFAGHGEEAGAGSDRIWSHQWYVWNAPTYNGVTFGRYSCSPELSGNFGTSLTRIGVICHELGHVFGAPDYYDTDYEGSGGEYNGLGNWDIMSSGSWNDNGRTPARHGAYTAANIYQWTTATVLTDPQAVRIPQSSIQHDVYRINTSTNGDYFLLENRQRKGFDRSIPGHGLIVYHVHSNARGASVSNSTHPQQLYVMDAANGIQAPDASPSSYGSTNSSSAPFPGAMHKDSLTDNSTPWLRPWSGVANNTPLWNIQESPSDSSVFFYFKQVSPITPTYLEAHYTSEYTATANWDAIGAYPSLVLVSHDGNFFTPVDDYTTGDTLDNGNIVVYSGNALNRANFTMDSAQVPDTLYFKLFVKINGDYVEGPIATAIPYEYYRPQPTMLDATYTEERTVEVNWTTSEECRMLVLMSRDNVFDTPYGQYTTGDETENGDVVFYYGEDAFSKTYNIAEESAPDTLYFKLFCRLHGDEYSVGLMDVALPYEFFKPHPTMLNVAYTDKYHIEAAWASSEPCRMLVLMSADNEFDTPNGTYTTGERTAGGDLVYYYGEDLHNRGYDLPRGTMPDTMYFKVFCRYYGDDYSNGITAVAAPLPVNAIEQAETADFSIMPNPACNSITVQTEYGKEATVVVTDMLGRRVISKTMYGSTILDTSKLPRGSYVVAVETAERRSIKKLLLQ
ncbi:MAG: M6 family metalloprotease domain-containing protein [Bacteroidales bacterium]|nr:M6 family metalloprotease domain-containing protein [Bacteroidales bacterium]